MFSATMANLYLVTLFFVLSYTGVLALPEQGIWNLKMKQNDRMAFFTKTMFANSSIYIKIVCNSDDKRQRVAVEWLLRYSPCADEFSGITKNMAFQYLSQPSEDFFRHRYKKSEYKHYKSKYSFPCSKDTPIYLQDYPDPNAEKVQVKTFPISAASNRTKMRLNTTAVRHKRAATRPKSPPAAGATKHPRSEKDDLAMVVRLHNVTGSDDQFKTATTWADGAYLLVLNVQMQRTLKEKGVPTQFEAEVTVWMKSSYGYLSAIEWPFLIFYGVMCLVYLGYAIAWTILSACHWRDILRVQFWIGAVILLGMLEKAMFYAEYQSINSTGRSVRGAVIFAEFISCIKRTLARLLLMVVSIGYGIVKPRLGPALMKVVVIGIAYFVFALIEGCIRVLWSRFDMPRIILLVQVPLALTDAVILWWTFTYLVQTIQQMRLRRNVVKFNLYKHFSNILILVVGVSIVFMGWSVFYQKWFQCKRHWREIWVDDAFWHILFSVILLVIIWLWRPSKNNQRYAYSPVLDADDDADEDILMDNLTTGELTKKMSHNENGTMKRDASKPEDDLRWVEEHIPKSTAAENVFPLVDSDEEIATTKLHLNKME